MKESEYIVSQQSSQDTLVTSGQWWTYRQMEDSLCVLSPRDKTARVWLGEDQREYKTVRIVIVHKGFVTCTCVVYGETECGREKCE